MLVNGKLIIPNKKKMQFLTIMIANKKKKIYVKNKYRRNIKIYVCKKHA